MVTFDKKLSTDLDVRRSAPTTALEPLRRCPFLVWALPVVVVLVTAGLRLIALTTSYDLFIDEPFYVTLGQSVAQGHMPFAAGSPFFLHPPGHSVLEALWIHLVGGLPGSILDQVLAMRYLNVVFASGTALMLYLIGRRLSTRGFGLLAATAFAISPWFIRQNSFVLLETSALTFVLGGFLGLLHLPPSGARRRCALVGIGLSFGYGILVKEFAVFVTILPMVLISLRRADGPRRRRRPPPEAPIVGRFDAAVVVVAACVPYLVWCMIVIVNGDFAQFWAQTTTGFHRAAGAEQISGFNQSGTPSFLSTILKNAPQFWTTYLLMGLGVLASIHLLRQPGAQLRVLGAFGFGSIPLLGYSVLLGANEEQFYYYLLIPSCLAVAVCAGRIRQHSRPWVHRAMVVLAIVWMASDLTNWVAIHTTTDNQAQQVDNWMRANVPDGTAVAVTDSVQREIFLRYRMINDDSLTALDVPGGVRYLVVFEKEVSLGYAFIGPDTLAAQIGDRRPVFTTKSQGGDTVDVYEFG